MASNAFLLNLVQYIVLNINCRTIVSSYIMHLEILDTSSVVLSTKMSETGRPSIGLAIPRHLRQTKSGFATSLPCMPLHPL